MMMHKKEKVLYSDHPPPLFCDEMEVLGGECCNSKADYDNDNDHHERFQQRRLVSCVSCSKFLGMLECKCGGKTEPVECTGKDNSTRCSSPKTSFAATSLVDRMKSNLVMKKCSWAGNTVPYHIALLTFLLVLSSTSMIITPVHSFNIDVPSVITHRGPSNSMFGFSVAMHRDSNISWYGFHTKYILYAKNMHAILFCGN